MSTKTPSPAQTTWLKPVVPDDLLESRLLSKQEVAGLLGVSTNTIDKRVIAANQGLNDFPLPIRAFARPRWPANQIKDWIERQSSAGAGRAA